MELNREQKLFIVFDCFLMIFIIWGFTDTFIKNNNHYGWFVFALFIFIIFNIVEFPYHKKELKRSD